MNAAPAYCAFCMIDGFCTPAVQWPGVPMCREHLAENQIKCEGLDLDSLPAPTVPTPAALQ